MCIDHHRIRVQKICELDVGFGESYLGMRPLGSHYWTLDCYMVNLAIVLSLLSLVLKGQVGASGVGVYGSEGWEAG
jgi:hypothetical protein